MASERLRRLVFHVFHMPVITMIFYYSFINMIRIMTHGAFFTHAAPGPGSCGIMRSALKNGRYVLNPARAERQQR
jgi:hypothetical protein